MLYNGKPRWTPPTDMRSLIQSAPAFLQQFQPQLYYYLIDEHRLNDDQLAEQTLPLSGLFAVEKADTHAHVKNAIEVLLSKAQDHPDKERINRILTHWVKYHLHHRQFKINVDDIKRLEDVAHMLTLEKERQQWKQEGVQEGVQLGRRETAKRLLRLGLGTEEQIAEATDLPLEHIRALKAESRH